MPASETNAAAAASLRSSIGGPGRAFRVSQVSKRAVHTEARGAEEEVVTIAPISGFWTPVTVGVPVALWPAWRRRLRPETEVVLGGGRIHTTGMSIPVTRWWPTQPRLQRLTMDELAASRSRLAEVLADEPPDDYLGRSVVAERSSAFIATLRSMNPREAVEAAERLIGLGPGATPAGDDVLAGVLVTLRHVPPAVVDMAALLRDQMATLGDALGQTAAGIAPKQTSALSRALLRRAAAGDMIDRAVTLFEALGGPGDAMAARRLIGVGHTSGRDLLVGVGGALGLVATADVGASGHG